MALAAPGRLHGARMASGASLLQRCRPSRCGHAFFGTDHSLFATDTPFDAEDGRLLIRTTIAAVNALEIPQAEKDLIFSGNARRLLKLN